MLNYKCDQCKSEVEAPTVRGGSQRRIMPPGWFRVGCDAGFFDCCSSACHDKLIAQLDPKASRSTIDSSAYKKIGGIAVC